MAAVKLQKPHTPRLPEQSAERMRRQHEAAIAELQKRPGFGLTVIEGVELRDGIATPIAHNLGRRPVFVTTSCPRGPTATGRIEEVRAASSTHDRAKVVVLKATGMGATITVDVMVL